MSGKRFYKLRLRGRKSKVSKVALANYRYEGDTAVGTYVQDEAPILQANYEQRKAEDIRRPITDLDMGFKFASIPKVRWLEIQRMGIDQDPTAIINYLNICKANNPDENYFTTNRRLI
jgi:hypothetical protein